MARVERFGLPVSRRRCRRQRPRPGLGRADQPREHGQIDEEGPGKDGEGKADEGAGGRQREQRVEPQGMVEKTVEIEPRESPDRQGRDDHAAETAAPATSLMRRPPGAELLLMAKGLVATAPPGDRLALVPPGFLIQSVVRPGSSGPISLDRILRARKSVTCICTTMARSVQPSRRPMKRMTA